MKSEERQFRQKKGMNRFIELAQNISKYNLRGNCKLSCIKLAIVYKKNQSNIIESIMDDLHCHQGHSYYELMGLSGYLVMKSDKIKGLQVHLITSLEEQEQIQDELFLRRKKIIDKLKWNKQMIFCYLQNDLQQKENTNDRSEILQLKRIDSAVCKSILWKGSNNTMYNEIISTWESINRYQLIGVLKDMKHLIKSQSKFKQRQLEWLSVLEEKTDTISYAFKLITMSKQYLVCSLQGYYSKQSSHFQHQYSVHWQIMDIFEDLWKEEGERINKELERMPLSYIGQSLKMNNYHSLDGFLPQQCFLRVFKPILDEFASNVICCLEAAKFKVLQNLQVVYEHYFMKTSIREILIELQLKKVQQICDCFLRQVQNAIQSQVGYVYAPAEAFWEMRNIRTSLYSEQQQANIQVKYIGKVYVRRVYESIRQSIPRFIGQGLLRKVSKYIKDNGLNNLLEVIRQNPFEIVLSKAQINAIKDKNSRLFQYDSLFRFFSLKINSTFKIKNLLQKNDIRWKQMYNSSKKPRKQEEKNHHSQSKQNGFFGWMKRFFTTEQRTEKRSRSNNKERQETQSNISQIADQTEKLKRPEQQIAITQKVWILVLNTNKKVDETKLVISSCQGFPERLRPSIWYWLSRRFQEDKKQVKLTQILVKQNLDPQIVRQVQKDLSRTPPPDLFLKKQKKLRECLRRVLLAYSLIDLQIKYTQGMNFIVAVALSTCIHWGIKDDYLIDNAQKFNSNEVEQKAFTILRHVMLKQGLRKIMFIEREHIAEICFRVDGKIKELSLTVWNIIQQSGFTCQIIFGPILISGLITWSKDIVVIRRIMDLLMCRGFAVLYKVIAGVTVMSQQPLSRLKNQQIYDYLRNKALDELYGRIGPKGLTQLFLQL